MNTQGNYSMEYRSHEPIPPQDMTALIAKFKKKLAKKESEE